MKWSKGIEKSHSGIAPLSSMHFNARSYGYRHCIANRTSIDQSLAIPVDNSPGISPLLTVSLKKEVRGDIIVREASREPEFPQRLTTQYSIGFPLLPNQLLTVLRESCEKPKFASYNPSKTTQNIVVSSPKSRDSVPKSSTCNLSSYDSFRFRRKSMN